MSTGDRGPGETSSARPRQIVVASNRGPVSFVRDDRGEIVPKRGAGGLVTAVSGALQEWGGRWIASAMSPEDRERAAAGLIEVDEEDSKYELRYLPFEDKVYDAYYNGVSNRILWFVHHYLWDIPRQPRFDGDTYRLWSAYRQVNEAFARALHEEGTAMPAAPAYLVQDYHLALVPAMLRELAGDAAISFFSHIPFAGPGYIRTLPPSIREEMIAGILGADLVGFHASPWAENFLLGCRHLSGAEVDLDRGAVRWRDRTVQVRSYPISIDAEGLEADARGEDADRARAQIREWVGDRKLILRVDRADLSKNILRGFLAYEQFLMDHPEWRGKVLFLAQLTPSREDVPEYQTYMEECLEAAARINRELGQEGWEPIRTVVEDNFPLTVAGYQLYDVLLVNPVFDGMNLVAKEGPVLNQRNGVLILSQNAGAFPEIGRHAVGIHPFDIEATAAALASALEMDESERKRRGEDLRRRVLANRPRDWLRKQLEDLEEAVAG
ncbi:MAG TPA: trehalose-6-phosphate synthase [Actinomycetota bacterium]|nr:trehalose-6-phosphate synthase [Actinomycetota bacterium]